MVYSDRGFFFTKAATYLQFEDPKNCGWDIISKLSAKKGTTSPGCQFKDGLADSANPSLPMAESMVKILKRTRVNLTVL